MRSLGSDEGKLLAVMGEEVSKQVQTMDGLRNLRKFCALISTERERGLCVLSSLYHTHTHIHTYTHTHIHTHTHTRTHTHTHTHTGHVHRFSSGGIGELNSKRQQNFLSWTPPSQLTGSWRYSGLRACSDNFLELSQALASGRTNGATNCGVGT